MRKWVSGDLLVDISRHRQMSPLTDDPDTFCWFPHLPL